MDILAPVKNWILSVAIKKGVLSAAKLVVSFAIAHGIKLSVVVGGVIIDTSSEAAMVVAINSGLKVFFNWLKIKYPEKFGWL